MTSKTNAVALIFLVTLVIGSAVLILLGYDVGGQILVFMTGFVVGWIVTYLLTKPRRYRRWMAVGLANGVLIVVLVSMAGLIPNAGWPVLGFDPLTGAFGFGFVFGVIQVIFGRFSGEGFRAED